jgi:hypothetical protein
MKSLKLLEFVLAKKAKTQFSFIYPTTIKNLGVF